MNEVVPERIAFTILRTALESRAFAIGKELIYRFNAHTFLMSITHLELQDNNTYVNVTAKLVEEITPKDRVLPDTSRT
jgi:hypothetical protein